MRAGSGAACALAIAAFLISLSGCSAAFLTNTDAIEHKLEVLSRIPKAEYRPIDLRLLGQTPPPEHLVADGDVLGIYIEGGPGTSSGEMPVRFPDDRHMAPAIGYPIPVRNGGYIRIPEVGLLYVRGMTIWQIEERIRHILLNEKKTHQPDKTQIHVSLMWTRSVNVMVIRQEETDITQLVAPNNGTDADRRSGQVVQLPAFRNDVLNALLETGGLPASEAENSVYIFKRTDREIAGRQGLPTGMVPIEQQGRLAWNQNGSGSQPSADQGIQRASYTAPTTSSAPLTPVDSSQPLKSVSQDRRRPSSNSAAGHSLKSLATVQPVSYQAQQINPPVADSLSTPFANSMTGNILPGTFGNHHTGGQPESIVPFQASQSQPMPQTDPASRHPNAIRIPLSVASSQAVNISEQDVVLEDGDIVLVESRNDEYFITGGLLGGGQYSLPRDRDIDIIDAVLLADTYSRRSQINQPTRAIGGVSVLNRDVTIGASRVIVERKLSGGQTHQFRISLYKAMRDPSQRILIEPGDRLFLEYTLPESIFAFAERHLLDPFTNGLPTIIGPQ